jgi:phage terminase large subunit
MSAHCLVAYPNLSHVQIRVDEDEPCGGVTDRLNEISEEIGLGYEIIPMHNGSSNDDEYYGNKGSELRGLIKVKQEVNMSKFHA